MQKKLQHYLGFLAHAMSQRWPTGQTVQTSLAQHPPQRS